MASATQDIIPFDLSPAKEPAVNMRPPAVAHSRPMAQEEGGAMAVPTQSAKGKGKSMNPPAVPLRTKTNKVGTGTNQRVSAIVYSS